MGVNISYMGTKKELAPAVVEVMNAAQKGIALDVFAGMGSVAEAIGQSRQVWTNDIQIFSYTVGVAIFTSQDDPLRATVAADLHYDKYASIKEEISVNLEDAIAHEEASLNATSFDEFVAQRVNLHEALQKSREKTNQHKFSLFTKIYADSFFGLSQAIQIDSIVGCINFATLERRITPDQQRWLTIGLGRAIQRVSTSTGHFAQYLRPKLHSYRTFMRQRRRSVWTEWLIAADEMEAAGTKSWRLNNRSFNEDCLRLLNNIIDEVERPSVIYADPPYTDDQYSRFYHLLETLILYDYPTVTGSGLYRSDRFRTPFSIKSLAAKALDILVEQSSRTGADLILSYPTNGLVYTAGFDPEVILKKHFNKVECIQKINHTHSTLGASKGSAKAIVIEQIFLGRQ